MSTTREIRDRIKQLAEVVRQVEEAGWAVVTVSSETIEWLLTGKGLPQMKTKQEIINEERETLRHASPLEPTEVRYHRAGYAQALRWVLTPPKLPHEMNAGYQWRGDERYWGARGV